MNTVTRRLIPATGLLVLGAIAVAQSPSPDPQPGKFRGLTAEEAQALERRVQDSIVELGVLESAMVLELRSELPGEATVVTIVPDGAEVEMGDLLIAFDDTALQQQWQQQKIAVTKAEAELVAAREQLESLRETTVSQIAAAKTATKIAQLARERSLGPGGELERAVARADRALAIAEQRIKVAEQQLQASEARAEAPDESPHGDQVETFALAVMEAKAELDDAKAERRLLTAHIRPHQTAVLDAAVAESRSQLQQTLALAKTGLASAESKLRVQEAILKSEQEQLDALARSIAKTRITAPGDGIVLHAVSTSRGSETIGPGATVREQQLLLTIPDRDQLRVRVGVHESQIRRVQQGQSVTLRFDALPNQRITGEVTDISRTPRSSSWFNSTVEYDVLVTIAEPPDRLQLGMTAAAEIAVRGTAKPNE